VPFLKAAVAYYASLGVTVSRVTTDNGSAYRSKLFAKALQAAGARHVRTRPLYTQDQRKGRALHPDQLARVGLRQAIRLIG
jgi:transposase InsO family protein